MKKTTIAGIGVVGLAAMAAGGYAAKQCFARQNKKVRDAVKAEIPPSFFQDLGWRGCKALVLGSTKAWEYLQPVQEEDGIYPLAFYQCSAWSQFSLLRCYFGHVGPQGRIVLVMDPFEKVPERFVSPVDAQVIHKLVFQDEGGEHTKKQKKYPLAFFPQWSVGFMKARRAKKQGAFGDATWGAGSQPYELDLGLVNTVKGFCDTRDLKLQVLVLSASDDDAAKALQEAGVDDYAFCPDATALNEKVRA